MTGSTAPTESRPRLTPTPEDLRRALARLPDAKILPGGRAVVKIPPPEPHEGPLALPLEITFHHETMTDDDGKIEHVWVHEGPVLIDTTYVPPSRTREELGEWLREQLGPRCLDVSIHGVQNNVATVRVLTAPHGKHA